jgi:two-component system, OmpR family, copper resistance phosphate regulon response regulator CusR
MRLLIVEDDAELAGLLRDGFAKSQIEATLAATFAEGSERARHGAFDVVLLDVLLPGGSGFELCRRLRDEGIATPVLMLTAMDAVDDRVRGLEAGADDYLPKPFAFPELLARVKALARRRPALTPAQYRVADLEVDLAARSVRRAGRPIALTAKEFTLLELFVRHPGRVLDRATITAHVWDDNHDPFANLLEVLVRRLRAKIDDGFEPRLITTMRGAGYRFGP